MIRKEVSLACSRRLGARAAFLLLSLLALPAPGQAALEFAGNVVSTSVGADTVDFTLERGAVARVEMLASDLARVRFNPGGEFTRRLSGAIAPSGLVRPGAAIFDTPAAVFLGSDRLVVAVLKTPFRVVFFRPDGNLVLADMELGTGWDSATGLIFNRKFAPPDEQYFGLGLRGGPPNRRGRVLLMRNVDRAAYGEFTDPLYSSTPFYYGLREGKAYGLFLDNPALSFFDMDSEGKGVVTYGALDGELDYYLMAGPEPLQVASAYARLTGFNTLPPKWTLGYHQSSFGYRSQAELLDVAATFRQLQIPCDALWLDLYYHDRLQVLSWDPIHFPTPQAMNAVLEAQNFKRVNIIDPVVRTDDRLWDYFAQSGFFVSDGTGVPLINEIFYGQVSWIDFSKRTTRDWYKQVLKIFLSTGVSAIWNDLNEPAQNFMDEAIYDFDGERRTDLQARNIYALQAVSLSQEALRELRPNERPWIISRSGYSGIQRYAANWSGDALSSFDSLRVSVQISLSMGLSGQNHFGHDIGGFLEAPSAELFIRWLEFGSLIPLFRTHAMDNVPPREPWRFGEPYTGIARQVINQRYRWLPYIYTLFESAARTGEPILAPPFFYSPSDPGTYARDQEFMLGRWLLVAPVIEEGATLRSAYLPEGSDWFDFYTDAIYPGGQQVTVEAPLERIPVFVRAGAILPTGPALQYVSEPVPARLTVDVYPGADSAFTLYEDDGATLDFERGVFLRTELRKTAEPVGVRFSIRRLEGSFTPPARSWRIHFHAEAASPLRVSSNGAELPRVALESELENVASGWFYREADRRLIVRVADVAEPVSLLVER